MGLTALHVPTIPLHIACMYHLNHLHSKLFLMAHEMVDREPENALSWYAVGVWYLCNGKWGQARSYLRCVPLWVLFLGCLSLIPGSSFFHLLFRFSLCLPFVRSF
jgi:anaphase-promoting complex subunit 6